MAISSHPFFKELSGSFGNFFTVKNYGDKTVVCKRIGKRTKDASPQQYENELLFTSANNQAKEVYSNLELREKARLRLKIPAGSKLYNALVKEFRTALKEQKK